MTRDQLLARLAALNTARLNALLRRAYDFTVLDGDIDRVYDDLEAAVREYERRFGLPDPLVPYWGRLGADGIFIAGVVAYECPGPGWVGEDDCFAHVRSVQEATAAQTAGGN